MVPHSRRHRIRQSANILGNCCMHQRQEWGIIAAAISHLVHDALMNIVGWLWVVLYVGIRRLSYQAIGNTLPTRWQWATMSILVGIGAVGVAASTPNWLLCCIIRAATSLGNDTWWWWQLNWRKKSGKNFYNRWVCTLINHGSRRCPTVTMGPHSRLLSIQQSANILCNRTTMLKPEKLSLIMFIC